MIASFLRALPAFALLLILAAAPLPARSQAGMVVPVEGSSIYGAQRRHDVDDAVPGHGIVDITADQPHAHEWGSAASVALPMALRRGAAVSAVFWARAGQPATVPVVLLARDAPHAAFSRRTVELSTAWRRIVVTGTAPADLAAGSHALSVQLGKAGTRVSLGPLLWLPGRPDTARIDAAFAAFRPPGVSMDVRVPSAPGVTLAGTLRIPRGHDGSTPPVTLLLAGGGPATRGVYALLADRLPVLALFAENDEIVSRDNVARARQVLAGHPDAGVIEVAGANHGFQPAGAAMTKGEVAPAVSIGQVLDLVPPWLAARLRAR